MTNSKKDQQAWIEKLRSRVQREKYVKIPALKPGGVSYTNFIMYMAPHQCRRLPSGEIEITLVH